ncbi:MAG: hypothetical protein ACYCTE_09195 [Acidimicrobiales bacterium]
MIARAGRDEAKEVATTASAIAAATTTHERANAPMTWCALEARSVREPCDEPEHEDRERDGLGVERVRSCDRRRRLHLHADLDRAERDAWRVEQRHDLRGRRQLSRRDERELVEEALGVLDDAYHPAPGVSDAPRVPDLQVKRRGHATRDGDLVRAGRVVPGDEREHRAAECSVWILGADLD